MSDAAHSERVARIETYFDRTAVRAWEQMTSDAPLGRIRATVRAGRDRMRAEILAMLPQDLTGARVLDAGCGTGSFAVEAARRGADVVAIDLSPKLVALARHRAPADLAGRIDFRVGDLLDARLGRFDHAVAMDVLIHYPMGEAVAALGTLGQRIERSILFTFAPRTPLLAAMHTAGKLFPRSDRSPAIEPVSEAKLRQAIGRADFGFAPGRTARVTSGFYISQVLELASTATRPLTSPRRGESLPRTRSGVDAATAAAGEGAPPCPEMATPPHPVLRADLSPQGRGEELRLVSDAIGGTRRP